MPPHLRAEVERQTRWPNLRMYQSDFEADKAVRDWAEQWMVRIPLVMPLPCDWDHAIVRRTLYVHKIAAKPIQLALGQIFSDGLWGSLVDFSGDWVLRKIRGGAGLSMHSYGLAVDFNASENERGKNPERTRFGGTPEGLRCVEIFESFGLYWGGRFVTPDAQHFQFATGC